MGFSTPKQEVFESSPLPPISKNSPKYADHPPNAGDGFVALTPTRGCAPGPPKSAPSALQPCREP